MAHPFTKQFEKALRESTPMDNKLSDAAEALLEKGYDRDEVKGVLESLRAGRIDDGETLIIDEALIAFDED